ncbi:NUDIX domain-containing protein [Patescibacteria group bacterium]|nr:NUDIX domain-containing protein [Patescibacteria group bacterium]
MEDLLKIYVVAGVVIEKDGKFLLVQEKQPKCYGEWNLPAGRVEKGDSIEATAIKEAKEETGFDIELIDKIDIFQEAGENAVKHSFRAKIVGGELKFPKEELLNTHWFSFREIESMKEKLRGEWVLASIKKTLKRK